MPLKGTTEAPFYLRDEVAIDSLHRMPPDLRVRFEEVAIVFLDVDGVLTDATRSISSGGESALTFSGRDGLGIAMLQHSGTSVVFISALSSSMVDQRARELGVKTTHLGVRDKDAVIAAHYAASGGPAIFVGDDLWDLHAIGRAHIGVAVGDAVPEVRLAADVVTHHSGGRGAVRQVCDLVLAAKNIDRLALLADL